MNPHNPSPPVAALVYSLRRFEDSLEEALGRSPTDEEIALQMGFPTHRVAQLRRLVIDAVRLRDMAELAVS